MDPNIESFIQSKRIAVAGASRSGNKFGNTISKELKQRGYEVFLIHPEAKEIGGEPCYTDLKALAGKAEAVVVCLPAGKGGPVLQEAAAAGIRKVWLQQGAETPELLAQGRELGLQIVGGKCILMYAPPVKSFHAFHRLIAKWTGQL